MCEYCGCRVDPEIAVLGAQHDAIVELGDEVLDAVRSGEVTMQGAVERLFELLLPHVRREELGVFRIAEEIGLRDQYVEDLEEDHRRFAQAMSDPETLDVASLEALIDDLYRHIAIEEYDLFPVVSRFSLGAGRHPSAV